MKIAETTKKKISRLSVIAEVIDGEINAGISRSDFREKIEEEFLEIMWQVLFELIGEYRKSTGLTKRARRGS